MDIDRHFPMPDDGNGRRKHPRYGSMTACRNVWRLAITRIVWDVTARGVPGLNLSGRFLDAAGRDRGIIPLRLIASVSLFETSCGLVVPDRIKCVALKDRNIELRSQWCGSFDRQI